MPHLSCCRSSLWYLRLYVSFSHGAALVYWLEHLARNKEPRFKAMKLTEWSGAAVSWLWGLQLVQVWDLKPAFKLQPVMWVRSRRESVCLKVGPHSKEVERTGNHVHLIQTIQNRLLSPFKMCSYSIRLEISCPMFLHAWAKQNENSLQMIVSKIVPFQCVWS